MQVGYRTVLKSGWWKEISWSGSGIMKSLPLMNRSKVVVVGQMTKKKEKRKGSD